MSIRAAQVLWAIILFYSCKNNLSDQSFIFKNLDEGMINTNRVITHSTEMIYDELEKKSWDISTKYKAEIWQPKASRIKELTARIISFLEKSKASLRESLKENDVDNSVTQKLFSKEGKASGVHDSLENYRHQVLSIDPLIECTFKQSFELIVLPKQS